MTDQEKEGNLSRDTPHTASALHSLNQYFEKRRFSSQRDSSLALSPPVARCLWRHLLLPLLLSLMLLLSSLLLVVVVVVGGEDDEGDDKGVLLTRTVVDQDSC